METGGFLRSQKVMRLATVSAGGEPHVAPVWYIYDGKEFRVGTHTRTRKAKNVAATGRAAFCIDVGDVSPIRGAAGSCAASLVTGDGVRAMAEEIISRYMDPASPAAVELLDDTDCIIRMEPGRVASWSY